MQKIDWKKWLLISISFVGFWLSFYLLWARLTNHEVACIKSINCNLVLKSHYSAIAGIPVTFFGMLAYLILLIITLLRGNVVKYYDTNIRLATYGISLTGFLYSGYLTHIQIFVLGATCIWCLASTILITIIFIIAIHDIKAALRPI